MLKCKKCQSGKFVKNGFIRGHQRYKCRQCSCVYTDTKPRGKSAAMKALAVILYTVCNASYGMIGRLLGVSNVAVLKWIRQEALNIERETVTESSGVLEVDEM